MLYIENMIKLCILMVCHINVNAGLSVLAFLEALYIAAAYDTGSCSPVPVSVCFIHLVSLVLIVILWSCEGRLLKWALRLHGVY